MGQLVRCQQRQHPLEQPLFLAPGPGLAQRHRQGPALVQRIFGALEAADVLGQAPVHQHGRLALGAQAVQHAQHPGGLASQHRLAELEDVIAGDIEHGRLDLLERQLAGRKQQRQLLKFLVRGQQVALDPVRKKRQGLLAGFALGHVLVLGGQALGDPGRQRTPLDRQHLQHHACLVERTKPGALLLLAVQLGQVHDGQHIVRQVGAVALQGLGTVLAGLAARNADLDQLALGKQAHRLRSTQQA